MNTLEKMPKLWHVAHLRSTDTWLRNHRMVAYYGNHASFCPDTSLGSVLVVHNSAIHWQTELEWLCIMKGAVAVDEESLAMQNCSGFA
jgi:hypothetical protein